MMKITWLGQAGLLFEKEGFKIMIDPYFSDSVGNVNPNKHRRVEIDASFLAVKPDVMIFTHNHLDHYDPETVQYFVSEHSCATVLSPMSVWAEVRKNGGKNNYVLFDRHTQWTEGGIRFEAVKACHSDLAAIGVVLYDGEKTYYVTGDTLYNKEIFPDLPKNIDVVFLPINGVGNNMNMVDAARFAAECGAKKVVPIHFGMFDELNPELFACENKVIPQIYKEIITDKEE
jgi:L-ascorbate metabolism protein UlaG (beta-lactamase superfamily)